MNKISLTGRLTCDPEMKSTPKGVQYCRFSVACQSKQKGDDGKYKADFFNCTAWSKLSETIMKYCHKGDMVGVSGSMSSMDYADKTLWSVTVDDIEFLVKANRTEEHNEPATTPVDDPNLPF